MNMLEPRPDTVSKSELCRHYSRRCVKAVAREGGGVPGRGVLARHAPAQGSCAVVIVFTVMRNIIN